MEFKTVEFIKGIIGTDEILEDGRRQIAFIGRSNVGKSSLINKLLKRNSFVRSSSMPGKTRQVDFFLVDNSFYFVDLPGYGYASLSGKAREKLRKLILWYLFDNQCPKTVVLIIDANVGIKDTDKEILDALKQYQIDFLVVANKADKIKKSELNKRITKLRTQVDSEFILFSSNTGRGREELLAKLFSPEPSK